MVKVRVLFVMLALWMLSACNADEGVASGRGPDYTTEELEALVDRRE